MHFFDKGAFHNDSAFDEYGAIMFVIVSRINIHLEQLESGNRKEACTISQVLALRLLAQQSEQNADMAISVSDVIDWKSRYLKWLDGANLPQKVKRYSRESAEREFEILTNTLPV